MNSIKYVYSVSVDTFLPKETERRHEKVRKYGRFGLMMHKYTMRLSRVGTYKSVCMYTRVPSVSIYLNDLWYLFWSYSHNKNAAPMSVCNNIMTLLCIEYGQWMCVHLYICELATIQNKNRLRKPKYQTFSLLTKVVFPIFPLVVPAADTTADKMFFSCLLR